MRFMLVLLTAHFVGDFLCQTDRMAVNKSKSFKWLAIHVATYTAVVATATVAWAWLESGQTWFDPMVFVWFTLATFVTHFLTDAVTSRWTTRLYGAGPWLSSEDEHDLALEMALDEADRTMVPFATLDTRVAQFQESMGAWAETRLPFQRHWFFVVIGFDQLIHAWTLYLTWGWAIAY